MKPQKLADYPELARFLEHEGLATTAIPIDEAGTIHAATMGYGHAAAPLRFYFVTDKASEKCALLRQKPALQGACVIGTYKDTPFTLQMRGEFRIVESGRHQQDLEAYYRKHSKRTDDIDEPNNVLLQFAPTWARFTDYSKGWGHYFLDAT